MEKEEAALIKEINKNRKSGKVSKATLRTDDRVLARITDGIYRQPASALRELISNAYDADASVVAIQTDAPRFDQIVIRDNGNGMDINALARMIYHIGGSAKRTYEGGEYGITNKKDPTLTPSGRRIIGKIGIGLFAVSQLTRHFQIITKVKGTQYRLIADVILRTYSEEEAEEISKKGGKVKIETGVVEITSVPVEDPTSHGTEIILLDLRPQAIDMLRSQEIWNSVLSSGDEKGKRSLRKAPIFHIGRIDPQNSSFLEDSAKLPWEASDDSREKFKKLYQAILSEIGTIESTPRLETTLDNYLRTLWTLSLSAPIDYLDKHPFDITGADDIKVYEFSQKSSGQATPVSLGKKETVREKLKLKAPERGSSLPFSVIIDDIQLFRPISFKNLPTTNQALKKPILFVGKFSPDLSRIDPREKGGNLSFESYFLWAPKIVPKENNGLLIRIGDASGALFDETFAKYQISEFTRLSQITAEVFVMKGLDAALNIDRESFNFAHPHYQLLMRWVHKNLLQLANTLKKLASDVRHESKAHLQNEKLTNLTAYVEEEVQKIKGDINEVPIEVSLSEKNVEERYSARKEGVLALNAEKILGMVSLHPSNGVARLDHDLLIKQIESITQILDAYGLLDNLSYNQQEELLHAIFTIFLFDKKD